MEEGRKLSGINVENMCLNKVTLFYKYLFYLPASQLVSQLTNQSTVERRVVNNSLVFIPLLLKGE